MFGLARRSHFDPFRDVMTLKRSIDTLFQDFFPEDEGTELARSMWWPAIDVQEEPDEVLVEADLPGLSKKDISIYLENNVLTIQGERKQKHEERRGNYHRVERAYGAFTRSFPLPSSVDPDKVEAHFKDGVLRIRLPKREGAKPKRIAVK